MRSGLMTRRAQDVSVRGGRLGRIALTLSPGPVAILAATGYVTVIIAHLASGGDLRDYIRMAPRHLQQSHTSRTIFLDPRYDYNAHLPGYDGQFFYYIALDPGNARYYMDWNSHGTQAAAYRYGRILYPMAARIVAFGRASWIPATLLLVNILGIALGAFAVTAWLRRSLLPAWPALIYAFYPGVALGLLRDLADPLAFSLSAVAAYRLAFGGRHRVIEAGVLFGLAGLTRETALVIPCVYCLSLLVHRRVREAIVLGLLATVPAVLWRICLVVWLGALGMSPKVGPVLPFTGLFQHWTASHWIQVVGVVVPSLLWGALALLGWFRHAHSPEIALIVVNVLLFVVLLNPTSYVDIYGSARMAIGVPLFALLALPILLRVWRRTTWSILAVSSVLWGLALAIPS